MRQRDAGPALWFLDEPTVLLAEKRTASPIPWKHWILAVQGAGQGDHSQPQILRVNLLDTFKMLPQRGVQLLGHHGTSIFVTLALADEDLQNQSRYPSHAGEGIP